MADKPLTAVSQTNRKESSKQVYADVIHKATRPMLHEKQKGRLPLVTKLAVAKSPAFPTLSIVGSALTPAQAVRQRAVSSAR